MTLELIYGCMFSGKTTALIEKYMEKSKNYDCLAINYIFDKRYTDKSKIVSHNKAAINCICIQDLSELTNNPEYFERLSKADYIFINEAQFFVDLKDWVMNAVDILNKNVVLCGLNLDYKREKFGELMDLSMYATNIVQTVGKCNNCENASLFTHRLVDIESQVLIGSNEYIPVCEKCWDKLNKNSQ
jgi:thymidine kinase